MKITLNPTTGEMSFEVNSIADALALLQNSANGVTPKAVEAEHDDPVISDELKRKADEVGLSVALYAAWEYLVQNENKRGGCSSMHVARALRISRLAAASRLQHLYQRGFAKRIDRGRYVARTP